jgi:signal transduction histidine kinase
VSRFLPASLRGRLLAAFVVLGLATWLGVGVALFVALRGLHAEATTARLADVTVPLVARARSDLAAGMSVPATVGDLRDQVAGTDVAVYLQLADGRIVSVAGERVALDGLIVDPSLPQGALDHGTIRGSDGTAYSWVASVLRAGVRGSRALIAATPDRTAADALRDLLATLPLVVLLTLVLGVLAATVVARSVTGPLRRLAEATVDVPRGATDVAPLPLEGPTEIRDLTLRFDRMRAEVASARDRESRLLADLRHDLRTPLTVIAGFADALRDGTATGGDADRAAAVIAAEASRMSDLVADIGAIEDLAAGRGLRPEALTGAELLADAATRMAGSAGAIGADLVVLPPIGDTSLTADRRAVERIVANLVDNAVAAIGTLPEPADGPRGHVWLEARTEASPGPDERVLLIVSDDGPGFPPGLVARAFDRFVRGDPARSGPGSGLGLAIVRELALAQGGSVHAENVAPHGARVSVSLPRLPFPPSAGDVHDEEPAGP